MGLLNFGKKTEGAINITCLAIGEDKNIMHRTMESTGEYLLDTKNLLAYDSFPEGIGNYIRVVRGRKKFLGLTSILYENMARPFSLKSLKWIEVMHKEEQIKEGALGRGCSKAVQRLDLAGRFDRMSTILLLAVAGVIGIALIFAFTSGLFKNIFK